MFGIEGYSNSNSDTLYLQIVDIHVAPAINLLTSEYFNTFDESI
jgi:hypothetical protein